MKRILTFMSLIMLFLPTSVAADDLNQDMVLLSNSIVKEFNKESRRSAVKVITERGHGSGTYIKN